MNFQDALLRVREMQNTSHYMVIDLNYDTRIVVSHEQGMTILTALATAEQMVGKTIGSTDNPRIEPLQQQKIKITLMSRKDYERYKMAALMGVSYDEVKSAELLAKDKGEPTP